MKPKVTHYRLKIYPEGINDDEIDRAMNLMIDALRFREVQYDMNRRFFCMSEVHNDMEAWSRYLEKVERELDRDNERP